MGKSKKSTQGSAAVGTSKICCYWCNKNFGPGQEELLIQHQVSKHFRCEVCGDASSKKIREVSSGRSGNCINLEGLVNHTMKMHRSELARVPNAKEGRENPKESMHIYGMDGVPEDVLAEWGLSNASATVEAPPPPLEPAPLPPEPPLDFRKQITKCMSKPSEPAPPPEPPSSMDLQQQVAEWIAKQKAEAEAEAELASNQSVDPLDNWSESAATPQPDFDPHTEPKDSGSVWRTVRRNAPAPMTGFDYDANDAQPTGTLPKSSRMRALSRSPRRSPSRGRWRRSRSRNRRSQSQSRRNWAKWDTRPSHMSDRPVQTPGRRGQEPSGSTSSSADSRTIQILEGVPRSRLILKNVMERFGRTDLCFMGNRNQNELPMVRFATAAGAEQAMQAIKAGKVSFDDVPVKAEFKRGALGSVQRSDYGYVEATSRDVLRSDPRRY